ncbi:hypothetical protein [Burkholderia orbicola]|uniref:hypothetical protein n=1 Tax=Burkholderia orbicola TaxID=2978683 RepID=UPI00264BCA84|nr:hypothetical protein [Burkholderia orbicola]MDN7557261.1 hypothetical protein [Burkholderia orbicola]
MVFTRVRCIFVEGVQRWLSRDDPVALADEAHALADWYRARRITARRAGTFGGKGNVAQTDTNVVGATTRKRDMMQAQAKMASWLIR